MRIPLFPLHSVLFPGGALALRIFEPRYLDMISRCMKNDSGFGVILIREGSEVGQAPSIVKVGTYSTIHYWDRRKDGLLGVTVRGKQRFRVLSVDVAPDQLVEAEIEWLHNEPAVAVAQTDQDLIKMLEGIVSQLGHPYITMPKDYTDAGWVGSRLSELLPLPLNIKQALLEMTDPLARLEHLRRLMHQGA